MTSTTLTDVELRRAVNWDAYLRDGCAFCRDKQWPTVQLYRKHLEDKEHFVASVHPQAPSMLGVTISGKRRRRTTPGKCGRCHASVDSLEDHMNTVHGYQLDAGLAVRLLQLTILRSQAARSTTTTRCTAECATSASTNATRSIDT